MSWEASDREGNQPLCVTGQMGLSASFLDFMSTNKNRVFIKLKCFRFSKGAMGVRGGEGESQCANYRINAELPSSNVRSLKYFCGEKFISFKMFFE